VKHPEAVIVKAKKMAELVERTEAGEALSDVCAELGIAVSKAQLSRLRAKYGSALDGWEALLDGRFGHEQKVNSALETWLYERKEADANVRAPALAQEILEKFQVKLSVGHINYLLRKRALTAPPGRPFKVNEVEGNEEESEAQPASVENAGIFFPGGSEARVAGERND